jgi:hypothetical protein
VTVDDPVLPSLEAVTVAVPAVSAVTTPEVETDATTALLELHVIARPDNTLLLASRVTAESCTVPPIWRVLVAGDTDTVATGAGAAALTVIAADAVCPSLEAVTDVLPALTALTRPEAETVAIAAFADPQVTTRPVSTLLFASRVTTESCCDPPICRVALVGDTETDATGIVGGALTFSAEESVLPSLEAMIIAVPGPTAVTSPDAATVAMLVLELTQVTVRPTRLLPLESSIVAVATAF